MQYTAPRQTRAAIEKSDSAEMAQLEALSAVALLVRNEGDRIYTAMMTVGLVLVLGKCNRDSSRIYERTKPYVNNCWRA